jgi:CubicO group peptidase (beta-lactamase class C family)
VVVDFTAVRLACVEQSRRQTEGIDDIEGYLAMQVSDVSNREIVGPLLSGSGASGVVMCRGEIVGTWGDPAVPEMLFSATKAFVGLVAGVAFDRGLLDVDARVCDTIGLAVFRTTAGRDIRWRHLLQQTSQWDGVLWGKPTGVDAQSHREGDEPVGGLPGSGWAYNDVRVNLLCLALTALFGQALPAVLAEHVMRPIGASSSWSWHGYDNAYLDVAEVPVQVVSGGAHWGGGLWMSAADLALFGELYLRKGHWRNERIVSPQWMIRSWTPCDVKPEYGYLWWLNDRQSVFPEAPATGRCARGNGGRHILWVDPARDLVIASHWGDHVTRLLADLSAAIPA